jgi:hypothetical protein
MGKYVRMGGATAKDLKLNNEGIDRTLLSHFSKVQISDRSQHASRPCQITACTDKNTRTHSNGLPLALSVLVGNNIAKMVKVAAAAVAVAFAWRRRR